MGLNHKQIGEVANRTGLSLRTIRYYEEVGLVIPSTRSRGGFRLYSEADIARLQLVKRMKPLELALDEMRDLLETLDGLESGTGTVEQRETMLDRLDMYRLAAEERCRSLRAKLESAEEFGANLRSEIRHQRRRAGQRL